MTKKDFELIAGALFGACSYSVAGNSTLSKEQREGARIVAVNIAYALDSDNPKFDFDKFLQACGIDTEPEFTRYEPSLKFK